MFILLISAAHFLEKVKLIILLVDTVNRDTECGFRAIGLENYRNNMKLQIRVTKTLRRFVPDCQNLTAYFIQISSSRVTRIIHDHFLAEFC